MTTQNEANAAEMLDLLKESAAAGDDPRQIRWAGLRVRVDGTPAQVRLLERIEARAAQVHDQPTGPKKAPPTASDVAFARAMGFQP